ncbi:MAG TPA: peptidoglycan DD-metalloendopeptidase family protein [Polyangia bacterium]|nr:peptidoglycan DD-metalloendopeptidase family protein [Polyangia bacterium]
MVGTILKDDLGNFAGNQFLEWVDNLHAADQPAPPPPPPPASPSPLEQIGNAVSDLGQAASDAFNSFVDQVHMAPPQMSNGVGNLAPPSPPPAPEPVTAPTELNPSPSEPSPPPPASSPFLDWTRQVDAPLPPSAPSLPHAEEPATATDQVASAAPAGTGAPSDLASRWKTQFDFGQTYTGDYRTGTPHRGVDVVPSGGGGVGTEVDAFAPGTVSSIFRDPGGAGGLIVYVQDQDGLTHAYMHLNSVAAGLQVGQHVDRGTPIATMGESGTEGSPHLHYEVRKNAASGDPLDQLIDPRPYLSGAKQPGPGGPIGAVQSALSGAAQTAQSTVQAAQSAVQNLGGAVASARDSGMQAFRDTFQPYAEYASRILGVDPSVITAMAISESGGGNIPGNSFFGMKGSPFATGSIDLPTWELVNGVRQNITDKFATFDTPKQAVDAWIDFLSKHTPGVFGARTPEEFAAALKAGGYMTDTAEHYAQTLRGLGAQAGDVAQNALSGASDVLGASQRLVADTAQNVGSAASQKAQDASSALTDLLETFRAPVATALTRPGTGNRIVQPPAEDTTSPTSSIEDLLNTPLASTRFQAPTTTTPFDLTNPVTGERFRTPGGIDLTPPKDITEAATRAIEDASRRPFPGVGPTGVSLVNPQFGPQAEEKAVVRGPADEVLTASEGPAARAAGAAGAATAGDLDALATLRRTAAGASQPPLEGVTAAPSTGQRIANAIDKAVAVTVSNMLSAPASLFTNATAITQNLTRPIESAATAAIKAIGGDIPGARTELGAAGRDLVGQGAALGDALATFGRTFVRGQDRPLDVRREAFPGPLGMLTTPALRLNAATDELVRSLGQAGAQAAELSRLKAQNPEATGEELVQRFAPLLQKVGQDAASQVGFQSGGSGIGTAISRWRSALTRQDATLPQRIAGAALQVAVPFSNVPDVILSRGLQRLPVVNEVTGGVQALRAAARGDVDTAQRIGARTLIASAVNLAIWAEVQQGNITGSGPDDPTRKAALMAARDSSGNPIWRPNSIRVGDRWFNYGGLGPVSLQLGSIANAVEQYELEGRKVDPNLVGGVTKAIAQTVGDAWYLQSVADIFDAFKTGRFDQAAGRVLGSSLDRVIPLSGAQNAIRQWQDQVVRDPQNPIQREMNRIPGLSELVQPKLEPSTGQPVEEPRDVVSVLTRSSASGQPDPVNEALARHNLGVSDAPQTITRGNLTIALNDDEQRRFVEMSGPEIARRVSAVINVPGYANLSPDQQRSRLETAIRLSRDAATVRLWASIPGDERARRVAEYRAVQQQRSEPQVILSR